VGAISVSGPRYRIEALGEAKILPALFKHAQALTTTLGGNVADPAFRGWHLAKPKARSAASREGTKRAKA
ncbi:MAG: hypothetical protein ACJ8GO_09735, partial [Ramlibacter sp.]